MVLVGGSRERGDDRFHQRFRDLRRDRIVGRGFGQKDTLLVRLQIRHAGRARRQVLLELSSYVRSELVVAIAADEISELLTGHVESRLRRSG